MYKAIFNGQLIAQSDKVERASGYIYFPRQSVKMEFLIPSNYTSVCPFKGTAQYFHVKVGDKIAENAAWHYPDPNPGYENIKDHIAFWQDVKVEQL